jgi:hypothetical protein
MRDAKKQRCMSSNAPVECVKLKKLLHQKNMTRAAGESDDTIAHLHSVFGTSILGDL